MENNLFIYRRKAKMRQLDLARKLNITEQAVSSYETGRAVVSIDRAVAIGRILKIDPKEIFPSLFNG